MPKAAPNVHSRLLIAALALCVVFLCDELANRTWDLYRVAPIVDLPAHVLAGMAATALAFWLMKRFRRPAPRRTAVAIQFLGSLLWEAVEMTQERVLPDPRWLQDTFFWDGFTDILAAIAGSLLVFPLLRWLRRHVPFFRPIDV